MKARIATITGACALIAGLLGPSTALAHHGHHSRADRNHDGLPDKWEHKHHLRLRAGQASADQDHDGLRNRAEFLAGDDPRDADSDDDGVKDGAEGAGKVVSFTGGVLKIELFGSGDTLSGQVTSDTEFECDDEGGHHDAGAKSSSLGGEGELGLSLSTGDDDVHTDGSVGGRADVHGDDGPGDDDDQGEDRGDGPKCAAAPTSLTAGTVVKEAELEVKGGGAFWSEVELLDTP
jgi:hypothetical protein